MADSYDVVVLGGGPPGENVAERVVQGGLSAVLVEAELVGGECSYWACMPSKALLRPPAALADARAVNGAKQAVAGDLDVSAVLARRDTFTHNWQDDSQVKWVQSVGTDLVRGHARLAGPRRVQVQTPDAATVELAARHAVVVATGTDAAIPPIPGLADARPWTSRDATSAKEAPGRLAVIGGGVVGCEMATAWAALGSQVTMLARDGLLTSVEPFAGELVGDALKAAGVDVRVGIEATDVSRAAPGGPVQLRLNSGPTLEVDEVLVATGRRPRTTDLGVDTIGLEPGKPLEVDDTCRVTGHDWLYAVGDVNSRALLTHMGKYQARACGDAIAARARGERVDGTPWSRYAATADHAAVPQVIFTNPEVAAVGRTEEQARQAGLRVRGVEYDLGGVAGASLYADDYTGQAKIVVDEDRRVLVGVTMVGPAVGEMLHAATVAVVGEVPLTRLWHAVPAYPTISEIWLRLLEDYGRDSA
jgi:dihydrolipoamide dehydrogenase